MEQCELHTWPVIFFIFRGLHHNYLAYCAFNRTHKGTNDGSHNFQNNKWVTLVGQTVSLQTNLERFCVNFWQQAHNFISGRRRSRPFLSPDIVQVWILSQCMYFILSWLFVLNEILQGEWFLYPGHVQWWALIVSGTTYKHGYRQTPFHFFLLIWKRKRINCDSVDLKQQTGVNDPGQVTSTIGGQDAATEFSCSSESLGHAKQRQLQLEANSKESSPIFRQSDRRR